MRQKFRLLPQVLCSGDFKPLRYLPKGKTVALGLVTTKFGAMEDKDELKRRIKQAAELAPLGQLALSPQCGFSSTVHGNDIAVDRDGAGGVEFGLIA